MIWHDIQYCIFTIFAPFFLYPRLGIYGHARGMWLHSRSFIFLSLETIIGSRSYLMRESKEGVNICYLHH